MITLLETYSISQIIIFIIMIIIALKELFELIDWGKERLKKHFSKEEEPNNLIKQVKQKNEEQDNNINQILLSQAEMKENMNILLKKIQILMNSDKDAIKAFITKEHHYFCYEQGWIDDYNLDCLEKRFKHYQEENGNSFVSSLMEEIRALPRQPQLKT